MKRGTTPVLRIKCDNIDLSVIDHIDFVFKLTLNENERPKLLKTYPENVDFEDNTFLIELSEAETRVFPNGSNVHWDVRPVTLDGKILNTGAPKSFRVTETLFGVDI